MRDEVLIVRAVVLCATTVALIGGGTTALVRWVRTTCGICWRRACPGGHADEILAEMLARNLALTAPGCLRRDQLRDDGSGGACTPDAVREARPGRQVRARDAPAPGAASQPCEDAPGEPDEGGAVTASRSVPP